MSRNPRKNAGIVAAAALLALAACRSDDAVKTPAPAPAPEETAGKTVQEADKPSGPIVKAYTASEQGFLVGSYAVVNGGEILLIDTQMVKPEVNKYIEMVKGLSGVVTTIYITHPHPDHYVGAEFLLAAFPDAKLVAAPATAAIMKQSAAQTLAFMKSKDYFGGALKNVLASKAIVPEALTGETIVVGASELRILSYPDAEAKTAHPLYEPKTRSLFTGDLAYNDVHAWLKDTPPKKWITALDDLKKLGAVAVYPGHGEPGGPEILDATLEYLKEFEGAVASSKSQKELIGRVKDRFPDRRLPIIVDLAAPSYFKK